MKLYCKILLFAFGFLFLAAYALPKSNHGIDGFEQVEINAAKNAQKHCNLGNIFFSEKNYIAALKEYEIAFNLTKNTNSSHTYLYNIARCYIELNNYYLAKNALLGAINKNYMNITYYDSLVDCFFKLNEEKSQLKRLVNDNSNPYNRIIIGLIYLKSGHKKEARTIFDEFINENPDMTINQDVKALLKKL